jgi:hypothetical protein
MKRTSAPIAALALALGGCAQPDAVGGSAAESEETQPAITDHCVLPRTNKLVLAGVERTAESFDGLLTHHWVPEQPRAIYWYFHGSGGSAAQLGALEQVAARNLLTDGGWGIVATSSDDRETGLWDVLDDDPATNADLVRLTALRLDLIERTGWQEDTPIVLGGFSGGAAGAVHAGVVLADSAEWPVVAFDLHNSGVATPSAYGISAPTFISYAEHDTSEMVTSMEGLATSLEALDVRVALHVSEEIPLDPKRFMRILEFPEERSQSDFDELVELGWIDATGTRTIDFDIDDRDAVDVQMDQWAASSVDPGVDEAIEQLRVVWATHRFNAAFADLSCVFFEESLANAAL